MWPRASSQPELEGLFERPWNRLVDRLAGPERENRPGHLLPRWLFLRALGAVFLSAFVSLAFQIHGLIGPSGIAPARFFLSHPTATRVFFAPSLLWFDAGSFSLTALVFLGCASSLLVILNVAPRAMLLVATALFLSFVNATYIFSSYQSDEMLVEAGVYAAFFAPRGLRPGIGAEQPPSALARFVLVWEWLRIYFESGVAKVALPDPQWAGLTAMDHYYENGPLPTVLGWYAQERLPHAVHAGMALFILVVELGVVWLAFLPRPFKLACFAVVTPMQLCIILTANYGFLNYLVLSLGFLLLDDGHLAKLRWVGRRAASHVGTLSLRSIAPVAALRPSPRWRRWAQALLLGWAIYASVATFALRRAPKILSWPAAVLAPLHLANSYALFAHMTDARYELEFQGTSDGETWVPYPYRWKPQDVTAAPKMFAPYQPRFDWNLWFASLEPWDENDWLVDVEAALLRNEPSVLGLFAGNPFAAEPPRKVRILRWRYTFATPEEHAAEGVFWRREAMEQYAPALSRTDDGAVDFAEVGVWIEGAR